MSQPNSEEIQAHIGEIAALRVQTRNWRLAMVLGILGIVFICVMLVVNSVRALAPEGAAHETFKKELKSGLDNQIIPPLKDIAKKTQADLQKNLQKEMDKATARAPEVMAAFNKELEILQTSLPERGAKVLEQTFGKEFKRRDKKIQTMFPGVTEDKIETLVHNIIAESHASLDHLSHVLFAQHTKALDNTLAHLEKIQKTEVVDIKAEDTNWEIARSVVHVLNAEMQALDQNTPTNKPAAKATKKASAAKKESK